MDTFCPNPESIYKNFAKKLQKICKKIAKKLQKRFFAEFLQLPILQKVLHFRPREESVRAVCIFKTQKSKQNISLELSNNNFSDG